MHKIVKVMDWTNQLLAKSERAVRSESAGGLKVKALDWTLRDLGSSPSQHSNFSCSINLLLEKYFIYSKILFYSVYGLKCLFLVLDHSGI